MPWLNVQTNVSVSPETRTAFLQEAVTTLASALDKSEKVFMGAVEPEITMIFAGDAEPAAMIQFAALGLPEDQTTELTRILCDLATRHLGIPGNRIFVRFEDTERHMWGFDGETFA